MECIMTKFIASGSWIKPAKEIKLVSRQSIADPFPLFLRSGISRFRESMAKNAVNAGEGTASKHENFAASPEVIRCPGGSRRIASRP